MSRRNTVASVQIEAPKGLQSRAECGRVNAATGTLTSRRPGPGVAGPDNQPSTVHAEDRMPDNSTAAPTGAASGSTRRDCLTCASARIVHPFCSCVAVFSAPHNLELRGWINGHRDHDGFPRDGSPPCPMWIAKRGGA